MVLFKLLMIGQSSCDIIETQTNSKGQKMDMMDLLKIGATMIQNNNDDSTTGLDAGAIAGALGGLLGGGSTSGGLDLSSIIGSLANGEEDSQGQGGLTDIISSWVGTDDNQPIAPEQVSEIVGEEKISHFAQELGISEDSARQALADALPEVVNQATPEGNTDIFSSLLEQVGGISGAMNLAGKLLR